MTTSTLEPDQPPATPVTPATPTSESFRLDDRVVGGPVLATTSGPDGGSLNVYRWMSWLRVRADQRVGVLVQTRREGDIVGVPIGYYRRELDDRLLAKIRDSVESIDWKSLPPLKGGDILANHYALEYHRGSLLIQRQFNARNFEFMAAIGAYMETASEVMNYIGERPAALMKASVRVTPDASERGLFSFRLTLENPGFGPIVITDPRVPAAQGAESPRMVLRVAPEIDGWGDLSWVNLAVTQTLPDGAPRTVVLPAGGRLDFDFPWRATAAGTHYIRGEWIDYEGPLDAVPGQLPMIPLTADGPPSDASGPYPVRGSAFATGVKFEV